MNTQDGDTVFDTPATQSQLHTTEPSDTPTETHPTAVQDLFQPDMFAPEQLQLTL